MYSPTQQNKRRALDSVKNLLRPRLKNSLGKLMVKLQAAHAQRLKAPQALPPNPGPQPAPPPQAQPVSQSQAPLPQLARAQPQPPEQERLEAETPPQEETLT